jgi:hypothetical protein
MAVIELNEEQYGRRYLYCEGAPELLFTENETNTERLFNEPNTSRFAKDGINNFVVNGELSAVNEGQSGTKAAANYAMTIGPGQTVTIRLRLTDRELNSTGSNTFLSDFDEEFDSRINEADEFYDHVIPKQLSDDARNVMRQSFAGLLWSKQFYHYVVKNWIDGDPTQPPPPEARRHGRNHEWVHLYNSDVISMPDKWEYPWYAAWDLSFHCVPLAILDSEFAKDQLILMLREWYMHAMLTRLFMPGLHGASTRSKRSSVASAIERFWNESSTN